MTKWGVVLIGLLCLINVACDETEGGEGYFFEDEYYEEEYTDETVNDQEEPPPPVDVVPEDLKDEDLIEVQDEEFKAEDVDDLISRVTTEDKLDTNKLVANIINNLKYISKQPVGIAFSCDYFGYFATNLLLPMKKGEEFTSIYLPRKFGQKKYHFVLLNFKGNISCKRYAVTCKRNDMGYKELFLFLPEEEHQRTQCGMVIAIADEYLTDIETRLNLNYRIGEEDANYTSYGNVQYILKKELPEGV